MMAIPDALILLVVYFVAGAYTLLVYPWIAGRDSKAGFKTRNVRLKPDTTKGSETASKVMTGSERLGLSIVAGTLFLAVVNNYLSALLGSVSTRAALVAIPLCAGGVLTIRGRWKSLVAGLRPTIGRDLAASAVCAAFILAIAHKLFFWESLSSRGLLYPDLPWHVGRVAQQAFQSSAGFWPLSPLAFPGALPFVSFVADSLVAATFRYLPMPLHAFNYSQVLFCWAIVLWTAVALIAGSGAMKTIVVLTTAILGVPLLIWGLGSVGLIVFVFFTANPNSLIAWPVALALAFHVYRSFRRRSLPSLPFLLLMPPAALFFKANQAPVFFFLQAAGLSMWALSNGCRSALKWPVVAGTIWAAAVLLTMAMGPWPVSAGVHPSLDNLWHYAHAAFPAQPPGWQLFVMLSSRVLIVAGVCAAAVLLRRQSGGVHARIADVMQRDVAVPIGVLVLAIAYVVVGWWLVTPSGLAEGEPMHVNIELMMWLCTVIVAGALFSVCDHDDWQDVGESKTVLASSVSVLVLGFCASMVWSVNGQPMDRGGIPLDRHYDIAVEAEIRDAIRTRIPEGDCFRYGRRYAIYVGGQFDPDSVIAATGCPVINGRRWRGYLGDNDPDSLKRQYAIAVDSGRPFRVIEIGGVPGQ